MRAIEILLTEDNPADILLTEEAFEEAEFPCRLHVARDGVEGLAFLRREGRHAGAPTPDVILMDLNMPRLCTWASCPPCRATANCCTTSS